MEERHEEGKYPGKMRLENWGSSLTGVRRITWDSGESPQQLLLRSNKAAGGEALGRVYALRPPQRLSSCLSRGCFSGWLSPSSFSAWPERATVVGRGRDEGRTRDLDPALYN